MRAYFSGCYSFSNRCFFCSVSFPDELFIVYISCFRASSTLFLLNAQSVLSNFFLILVYTGRFYETFRFLLQVRIHFFICSRRLLLNNQGIYPLFINEFSYIGSYLLCGAMCFFSWWYYSSTRRLFCYVLFPDKFFYNWVLVKTTICLLKFLFYSPASRSFLIFLLKVSPQLLVLFYSLF